MLTNVNLFTATFEVVSTTEPVNQSNDLLSADIKFSTLRESARIEPQTPGFQQSRWKWAQCKESEPELESVLGRPRAGQAFQW